MASVHQAFDLNGPPKSKLNTTSNQTGQWEHESLAKIPVKVFRHLDDKCPVTSAQLCFKHPRSKDKNQSEHISSDICFLASSTVSGKIHLTDIHTGNNLQTVQHQPKVQNNLEIHKIKYFHFEKNKNTSVLGCCCMDGSVKIFKIDVENVKIDENPIFEVRWSCQKF